jgi:hypothetical protein
VKYRVRVRGSGRSELAAYGVSDAEHQVEKQIRRLWPEARVYVREVRRIGAESRIAEEFQVEYRLEGFVHLEAGSSDQARREAFRQARERFAGTHYWTIAWDTAEVEEWAGDG